VSDLSSEAYKRISRWRTQSRPGGLRATGLLRTLRAPDPGVGWEGLRFILAGSAVTCIYITVTTVLASVVGTPFQVALAIGFCTGLAVHFTLQRLFVWRHETEFALPLRHQAGRYLVVSALQYAITAATTSLLAPALAVPTEIVYLLTVVVIVCANFLLFRHVIFHADEAPPQQASAVRRLDMSSTTTGQARPKADRKPPAASERRGLPGRLAATREWPRRDTVIDTVIATLAVLLVASPMLFTVNGFAPDFTNDIWMSSVQQHMIAAHLHPTLFLNTEQQGIFQPQFVFYGGPLFAVTGGLAAVLGGSTLLGFYLMTLAGIAGAYGGLFWIARQLGVRGRLAHAPAFVFVTSAYYVTDLYGRGAWAEFMGVSSFVLVLAASLRLVRGPWRFWPIACLVAASVVFTGSHNITLLLGTTITILALAGYWLLSGRSRQLPWRRMAAVVGLIALGGCLNAWSLLPDVAYANNTLINNQEINWGATGFFNTFPVIFNPLRMVPSQSTTPALYVQAPVLALIWGLLMMPLAWRQRRLRPALATSLIALVGLLAVIMSSGVYSLLPNVFQKMQFPYRLETYVTLACVALVLIGTVALSRRAAHGRVGRYDRHLKLGLGFAVIFSIGLCVWQLWVPNTHISAGYFASYSNRENVLQKPPTSLPNSWNAYNDYGDRTLPVVAARSNGAFDPGSIDDDKVAGLAKLPEGPFLTNIAGGPYLVHVGGDMRVVGRSGAGYLILERTRGGSGPLPYELSTQTTAPIVLGRAISELAAIALLGLALFGAFRSFRRRSAASSPPESDPAADARRA
jgi:putative flippase GtrA